MSGSREQRILIFRIGHLGDAIVALPALWALRAAFPGAKLTFLANEDKVNTGYVPVRDVLPESGLIDDWLTYPTGQGKTRTALALTRLIAEIRRRSFDDVFYLMPRTRTTKQVDRDLKFFRAAGITDVRCIDHFRRNLIELPLKAPLPAAQAESEFLLDCVASAGVPPVGRHDLGLTDDERRSAREWLAEKLGSDHVRVIGLAPGSKWPSKIWPKERFINVIRELIDSTGIVPVILGGPEDYSIGQELIKSWGRGINAAGELSVRRSAAVLEHCEMYLGNDTGVMHLAASVDAPCVAVFAAIDFPGRWSPFGEKNVVFRTRVDCEGCFSPNCPNNLKCLIQIDESSVLDACRRMLSREGPA